MKAILTYLTTIDGKPVEQTRLFNTEKAKKICDVKNSFGITVQEIYVTEKGVFFLHTITGNPKIEVPDQNDIKKWIGENEPEKYIKFFGEVEEG